MIVFGEITAMKPRVTIGLIGDYRESVLAHQAIPVALQRRPRHPTLQSSLNGFLLRRLYPSHVSLDSTGSGVCRQALITTWRALSRYPARAQGAVPFLGTCGGFQHAIVEYAQMSSGGPMQNMLKRRQILPVQ